MSDLSDVQEVQSLYTAPIPEKTIPINYKQFYDAVMKLKDGVSANDVLSILWLVPSFSLSSAPVLSVRSDSQKAPFLYLSLEALQHVSRSSELSIITHDNSNDLAVWTRLFDCCSYWIQPSLLPLPVLSNNSESSEDEYRVETTNDSLIIEHPTDSLIIEHPTDTLFSSTTAPINSSHLPSLECESVYSLTTSELDSVISSLLRTDVTQKCIFEWSELDHSFVSRLNGQALHAVTRSVPVSLLMNTKQSEVVLMPDQPIHILNQFNSVELLRYLYMFLEKAESLHFSVAHPTKNPLTTLLDTTSPDHAVQYYGCSVVGQTREHEENPTFSFLSNRSSVTVYSKPRYLIGLLAISEHCIELIVSYADWEKPEGILRSVVETSFLHDDYLMIIDDDIQPSLLNTCLKDQFGETSVLFTSPSSLPPITRDPTTLSQLTTPERPNETRKPRQIAQESRWEEELLLQTVSELVYLLDSFHIRCSRIPISGDFGFSASRDHLLKCQNAKNYVVPNLF